METSNQNRRRKTLTLPLPQRDPPPSTIHQSTPLLFIDLFDRLNLISANNGSTLYKVRHRSTAQFYALRILHNPHPHHHHNQSLRRQIHREIKTLRDLNRHNNIVNCHDINNHNNGETYLLLDFIDGGSLKGKQISNESHLANLSRQILHGLDYLHRNKIVHRGIKPSNLLIDSENQVKIADLVGGRILELDESIIGYMCPERISTDISGGEFDECVGDVWSFGVCMLELYMGRFPFDGDWARLMCAICMEQPPETPHTASPELRDFVSCCLQRDPSRRWTAERLLGHPFVVHGMGNQNQNQS